MQTQTSSLPRNLDQQLADVLPIEGSQYFTELNSLRFERHVHDRYTFLSPESLLDLLTAALDERGNLYGDDHRLMQMGGLPSSAFSTSDQYRYLRVPAEGRVASMSIHELPDWVPVTIQAASVLPLSLLPKLGSKNSLTFLIDAEFRRHVNYATVVIAPNWFNNPSTKYAVMDAFPGPPSHGTHSLPINHKAVSKLGLAPGTQTTVGRLKQHLKEEDGSLLLGCSVRNLPGDAS